MQIVRNKISLLSQITQWLDFRNQLRRWFFLSVLLFASLAPTMASANVSPPIGYIDGVRKLDNDWIVVGWACAPSFGSAVQVQMFVNNIPYGSAQLTNQPAEVDIHNICGTPASSGIPYRFKVSYNGPVSGQTVRIDASALGFTTSLNGSNEFGLPMVDAESVIASANRILVLTAHEDDETWFSPLLAKYCPSKSCKVVPATSNRAQGYHPYPEEFINAMKYLQNTQFPVYDVGAFSSSMDTVTPQTVLNRWNSEAAYYGFGNANNVIKIEIDKFAPDVILTFDPRHGTSCHSEHRAVGQAVIDGVNSYTGSFDKSKLFLLESRRINVFNSSPAYSAAVPAVPKDKFSAVYDMASYVPARGISGFDFFINMLGKYPSQFTSQDIGAVLNSDPLDRITALLPIGSYLSNPNDARYTNGHAIDDRILNCGSFY